MATGTRARSAKSGRTIKKRGLRQRDPKTFVVESVDVVAGRGYVAIDDDGMAVKSSETDGVALYATKGQAELNGKARRAKTILY